MAVAAGMGYLSHIRHVREPLRNFSERTFAAIDARDGATLVGMLHPAEQERTGLDATKIARLLDWFQTTIQGYKVEDRSFRSDKERDGVASVERYYRAPDGRETTLSLYFVRTEEGPRLFLSHALVTAGLLAKYKPRFAGDPDRVAHWEAIRAGIEGEKAFFASLPLKGVTDTDGEATLLSRATLTRFSNEVISEKRRAYEERQADGSR